MVARSIDARGAAVVLWMAVFVFFSGRGVATSVAELRLAVTDENVVLHVEQEKCRYNSFINSNNFLSFA